jgi:transposase
MRYGLIGNFKRSWNKIGKRTTMAHSIGYVNRYLYTAISPMDGDVFNILGFDDASTKETDIFLEQLKIAFPNNHLVVIWDNAPFHKPKILHQKENISIVYLPSYGQELNPVERYFGEMRKFTANQTFDNIETIETALINGVLTFENDTEKVKRLSCWDWIEEQIKEVYLLF